MKIKTKQTLAYTAIAAALALSASSAHAITVTASANDGNGPENTLDNDFSTRWSANGDGQYLQYDLGEQLNIESLDIAFYKGDQRTASFDVQTSEDASTWTTVFSGEQSTSTTEQFNVALAESVGQYVKIIGYGNSSNSWNSITEVDINTTVIDTGNNDDDNDGVINSEDNCADTPAGVEVDSNGCEIIDNGGYEDIVYSATASADDGNVADNVLDSDTDTRWSANGDGQWLQLGLGSLQNISAVNIAFFKGSSRTSSFDILTSKDGENWSTVLSSVTSSGESTELETFSFNSVEAQYVRYVGYGNSSNSWNSLTEMNVTLADTDNGGNGDNEDDDNDGVINAEDNCPDTPSGTQVDQNGCQIQNEGELDWDMSVWDLEGGDNDLDPVVGNSMVFNALEAQHVTSNGNGWRHELKIKSSERVAMTEIYEDFQANIKMDISTGSKIIVAQHHASDTGTIVKLYVADSRESGFDDSVANNGVFDVYVRMAKEDGSGEEKHALGTIVSGDDFDFQIINNFGYVTVNASGTNSSSGENWDESFSLQVEDSSASYLKFGNYLQAQYADTLENVDDSADWADFYQAQGITESTLTFTDLSYYRDTVAPDNSGGETGGGETGGGETGGGETGGGETGGGEIEDPISELSCEQMYSCWSDVNDGTAQVTGTTTISTTVDGLEDVIAGLDLAGNVTINVTGSGEISIKDKDFAAPVLIKSSSLGGASLDTVSISNSSNIAVEGFKFAANDESTRVKIVSSTNIKILRNDFDHSGVTESQSTIVLTGTSQYIEIAYNNFKDKDISNRFTDSWDDKITGSFIKTQFDGPGLIAKNVHIHRNNFSNIKHYIKTGETSVSGDSDREAIAMGIADSQDEITNNVIEYNLFENCDGENEIITVKTSNNVFRYNTFKNSMGSLSFRLGNNNIALGNYFYGVGASENPDDPNYQTGGVRTYSDGHIIRDNYMEGLTGTTWRLPILVDNGDTSDTLGNDSHQNSTNVTVYNNTLVNNQGGLTIGGTKYGNKPTDILIQDNLAVGNVSELFTEVTSSNNIWSGNQAYAYGDATPGMAQEVLSTMPDTPAFFGPLTESDVGTNAP